MKFKGIIYKIAGIMCSVAFFSAVMSLDKMCIGTYCQPHAPESLDKYRQR